MQSESILTIRTSNVIEAALRAFDERLRRYLREEEGTRKLKDVPFWHEREVKLSQTGSNSFAVNLEGRCRLALSHSSTLYVNVRVNLSVHIKRRYGVLHLEAVSGSLLEENSPRWKSLPQ